MTYAPEPTTAPIGASGVSRPGDACRHMTRCADSACIHRMTDEELDDLALDEMDHVLRRPATADRDNQIYLDR